MGELDYVFKEFKGYAKDLGAYEKISIDELANKYCEATDEGKEYERNVYFCALVLRFWYKIHKLYVDNITLNLTHTDYFDWVTGAIMMACEKGARTWQTNPKLNAQQVINQVLATRFVAAAYYESNLQKNQGRHLECSLDTPLSADDDATLGDIIPDEATPDSSYDNAASWIQDYIDKNKIVEAIILDTIAHKDVYKHSKKVIKEVDADGNPYKYTQHSSAFWPFKLVKELTALDESYIEYFLSTYSVSRKAFEAAFAALAKANNQKKYKMVDATVSDFKKYLSAGYVA